MNVDSIKSTIQAIPSQAKGAVKSVGESAIKGAATAGSFISQHTPEAVKTVKVPQAVDTFVRSAKEKTPEVIKKGAGYVKNHKEAFAGAAVIIAAVLCAASIIKGIVNKITETKQAKDETKLSMHQG